MAKTFTLPNVEVGCVIEYYYTLDLSEHFVYDSHWILSEDVHEHAVFSQAIYQRLRPHACAGASSDCRLEPNPRQKVLIT